MTERHHNPEQRLLELLSGQWIAAAITTAAELGVPDLLAERPHRLPELAARAGCEPEPLLRVLRVLIGEGLLAVDAGGLYSLTDQGAPLAGALGQLARFMGSRLALEAWIELPSALRARTTAFDLRHGASLFEYLDRHEADAELYHRAVDDFTRPEGLALVDAFDFGAARSVVDVGGGRSSVLLSVAERYPQLRCIVYDRPAVAVHWRGGADESESRRRIEFIGGDFFASVPQADHYVIKHVLHNWGDAEALQILRHCARALPEHGRVLLIERLLVPTGGRDLGPLLDLEMLVLCGAGKERSKPEFRRLLRKAGLRLLSTHDLAGRARLLVCGRPATAR